MIPTMAELFRTSDIRVKDADKARIFDLVFAGEANSRKELLERFRFRPTVLTGSVRELIDDGLIMEEKKVRNRSGRPEIGLAPVPDRLVAVCFHAESRHLKAALVDMKGEILRETGEEFGADRDGGAFLELCAAQIESLVRVKPTAARLAGIGMSLPGSVDTTTNTFLASYRWPGVRRLDLSALARRFECGLNVRKDLDSILEHELYSTPGLATGNTLLFHWGFGVGFAFAQDGRNVNSGSRRFGEVGHTRIDPGNRTPCICGSAGCVETGTAIWALLPAIRRLDASLVDDEQVITDFCTSHPRIADLQPIRDAVETVYLALMNMYRIFFPTHILLLGPFFAVPPIARSLRERMIAETGSRGGEALDFRTIGEGYRGCIHTNARHVFARTLGEMLRAKF